MQQEQLNPRAATSSQPLTLVCVCRKHGADLGTAALLLVAAQLWGFLGHHLRISVSCAGMLGRQAGVSCASHQQGLLLAGGGTPKSHVSVTTALSTQVHEHIALHGLVRAPRKHKVLGLFELEVSWQLEQHARACAWNGIPQMQAGRGLFLNACNP
jgi:hypothetical protein